MSVFEPRRLEPQVLAACQKYRYEELHCQRVAGYARQLFDLLAPLHKLGEPEAVLLYHAALLHDVGHFIGYRAHHRHSAYLIRHDSALSDYPEEDRGFVALLARNHRKQPKEPPETFSHARARAAMQLSAILRVADGLDHNRTGDVVVLGGEIGRTEVRLEVTGLDLRGLASVLKGKAVLFKPAFERKVVWVTPVLSAAAQLGAEEQARV